MINSNGLKILTEIIEEDNFSNIKYYNIVDDIYHNVAKAAIHAINKVHELTFEIVYDSKYKAFGLDHREIEPKYKKINLK